MHTSLCRIVYLLLIVTLALPALAARAATIHGELVTEHGRPITGVDVQLVPQSQLTDRTDLHRQARSNTAGRYTFEDLPEGSYYLQFDKRYWEPVTTHVLVTGEDRTIKTEMSMQLLFATLAKVQLMCFAYGVMFGIALLWVNYYLVPVPVKSLAWAGWIVIAGSLAIGAFKLEYTHTALLTFGGITVGWYIQWRGKRIASARRIEIDQEQEQRRQADEQHRRQITSLVGKQGVALTHLKACGMANFDGRSIEVRAETGFIDKDTPIVVRALEGSMPVVAKVAT